MSHEDYLEVHAASASFLTAMANSSPFHAEYNRTHPSEPTPAKLLGTLVHAAVLERHRFDKMFTVEPDRAKYPEAPHTVDELRIACERHGVEVKAKDSRAILIAKLKIAEAPVKTWEDLRDELTGGKTIISAAHYDVVRGICEAVDKHPTASALLCQGQSEVSAFWRNDETGVQCKARFDYLNRPLNCIVDLKTTMDGSPRAFRKDVMTYGYHRQSALYLEAAHKLAGITSHDFVHLVVEKSPPHAISIYVLDDATLEKASQELIELLQTYKKCTETGIWPGYDTSVQSMSLPDWAW
jgi:hypothetical protein